MTLELRGALRRPWVLYGAAGFALVVAYFLVPSLQVELYLLIGLSGTLATLAGWRLHRPVHGGWLAMAVGIALYCLGDLIYSVIAEMTGTEPFPSLADAAYLVGQILFVVGVGRLAAPIERGLYRPSLIDAALVATAGAFVAWPLILDELTAGQPDVLSGAVALAYPAIDLILIGVLARHLLQPGHKASSVLILIAGGLTWLVADLIYADLSLAGTYVSGMWLDAGWLIAYVLIGVAALHPSMAAVIPSRETHEATISNNRLVLIGTSIMIPVLVFASHGPLIHPGDFPAFAAGSATLSVLGSVRLLGALHASRVLLKEQLTRKDELALRARTDRLTGLDNRDAVRDRLTKGLEAGNPIGLVFLDLDDFKRVNDAYGHPAGQAVLCEVADRMRGLGGVSATAARFGGDEFAIVMSPCPDPAQVSEVAQDVIDALVPDVALANNRFRIGASIGIVWSGSNAVSADDLLSRADIAMYQAKERGGGCFAMFEPEMHERALARTQLQNDLDGAVERGEIEPWFQPIFDLGTGDLVGVEALARWLHPERGLIPPDTFIPIAELSGAIGEIDRHVVHVAAARVAAWSSGTRSDLSLHVNITPGEAADPATVEGIISALEASGLAASSLVVEVTETALIDEGAVAPVLASLKAIGARLSIDDFGSQYAVLTKLGRLPVDIVKLDRSVIAGVESPEGYRLFEGIVRLAQSLHLETVAEGVESRDILPLLERTGCTAAQGYALGRPMPADAFTRLVRQYKDRAIA